jgi:hypothetical protein
MQRKDVFYPVVFHNRKRMFFGADNNILIVVNVILLDKSCCLFDWQIGNHDDGTVVEIGDMMKKGIRSPNKSSITCVSINTRMVIAVFQKDGLRIPFSDPYQQVIEYLLIYFSQKGKFVFLLWTYHWFD